jgi:hypothetical protein
MSADVGFILVGEALLEGVRSRPPLIACRRERSGRMLPRRFVRCA